MARVQMGALVTSLSGKAGGLIFSRNKAGFYTRNLVTVVNPLSPRQVLIRARMAEVSQAYATLDDEQKTGWSNYAANVTLPDRIAGRNKVSGAAMFMRTNMARKEAGVDTILEDAPTDYYLGEQDDTLAAAISEATQEISLTFDNTKGWAQEAGGKLLLYMGLPQNSSRGFFNGPWSLAGVVSGATPTAPTSPATLTCPKPVAAGQKVWLQARTLRADGRLSDQFRCDCIISA